MNRIFVLLGAVLFASACGSSSTSSTQVNGQMFGRNFSAQEAISAQQSGSGFSFNGTATYVEITDYAAACGVEGQGRASATGQRLVVAVAQTNASSQSSPPTATGTFNIFNDSASPNALVAQAYYEGGCMKQNPSFGQSGAVTVTKVNADGSLEGSFDVTFSCAGFSSCPNPSPMRLSGTFRSTPCANLNVNRTLQCQGPSLDFNGPKSDWDSEER